MSSSLLAVIFKYIKKYVKICKILLIRVTCWKLNTAEAQKDAYSTVFTKTV